MNLTLLSQWYCLIVFNQKHNQLFLQSVCYTLILYAVPGRLFSYLLGQSQLFQACQKIIKKLVTMLTIFLFAPALWNANLFPRRYCTRRSFSKGGNMGCSKWQGYKDLTRIKPQLPQRRRQKAFTSEFHLRRQTEACFTSLNASLSNVMQE